MKQGEESLIRTPQPNAGLEPIVRRKVINSGLQLETTVTSQIRTLELNEHVTMNRLISFTQCNPRGIVRLSKGVSRASVIVELACAFTGNIAVLGCGDQHRECYVDTVRLLNKHQIDDLSVGYADHRTIVDLNDPQWPPKILFTTPSGSEYAELPHSDVVILSDAKQAIGERMIDPLIWPNNKFHLIGLLGSRAKLSPYEQSKLRSIYGYAILDVGRLGRTACETQFAFIATSCEIIPNVTRRLKNNRLNIDPVAAYVQNARRNQQIAALAKSLRSGKPLTNERFALIQQWLENQNDISDLNFIILVDLLDHALELARLLPGWQVCFDPDDNLDGLTEQDRQRLQPQGFVPKGFIGVSGGFGYPYYNSHIIINAAGGRTAQSIP
ncbi:MAG: hypothetical protein KDA78_20405, partial [Planctomycetaceae bacterium]|nr:hypothetical protein [Planctomycetaceae bacterium]